MNRHSVSSSHPRRSSWGVAVAFTLLYLAWGTTYYAIRVGVHEERMPPALFSGSRVCVAGLILLAYLRWRGQPTGLRGGEWISAALGAIFLFILGNGLVAVALDDLSSGVIAVIVATTPLWMALIEAVLPRGDRLSGTGWLGLLFGLGGVILLLFGQTDVQGAHVSLGGALLGLCSALCWAVGSLALRYRPRPASHLASAAYQMILGGAGLSLVGLVFGEGQRIPWPIPMAAIVSVLWLLVVGSLIGFVAFNWLLGQVSAARVGTYAYVNPLVAILVAWILGDGRLTAPILAAMVIILTGVALVRQAGGRKPIRSERPSETVLRNGSHPLQLESAEDLAHP